MKTEIKCIMLIDDNPFDIFIHERVIRKNNESTKVISRNSALDAIEYLKSSENIEDIQPDLIFLDINMPCMNGWEFLQEYKKLDKRLLNNVVIVMLSTSDNSEDVSKAKKEYLISEYVTKPLTLVKLKEINDKYFINKSIEDTSEKVIV